MVSAVSKCVQASSSHHSSRCLAPADDLDSGGDPRSHAHTQLLMDTYGMKDLWNDYGVIDNILVRHITKLTHEPGQICPCSRLLLNSRALTFTSCCRSTCSIKSSREHSKTISLPGSRTIYALYITKQRLLQYWQISIGGTFGFLCPLLLFTYTLTNRSIAAAPSFPGLRRFNQGRGFKQWTGDDSKALMKVCRPCSLIQIITQCPLGIPTGDRRACAPADGPRAQRVYGLLLLGPPLHAR